MPFAIAGCNPLNIACSKRESFKTPDDAKVLITIMRQGDGTSASIQVYSKTQGVEGRTAYNTSYREWVLCCLAAMWHYATVKPESPGWALLAQWVKEYEAEQA